jgi:hypothetical protein
VNLICFIWDNEFTGKETSVVDLDLNSLGSGIRNAMSDTKVDLFLSNRPRQPIAGT